MENKTFLERRKSEPLDEAARRIAIDAMYASRDSGGTMHDAGAAAGDAVSSLYTEALYEIRSIAGDPDVPAGEAWRLIGSIIKNLKE